LPANAEVLSTTNYHSYLYSGDKEKELHLNQYLNLYSVSKEGAEVAREIMSTKHDSDTAMASDVGGIDIQNIDVVHKNGSARIQFNEQAVRDVLKNGFAGFTPVIINITPIQSPLPLLGINPAKQPEEPLAKV